MGKFVIRKINKKNEFLEIILLPTDINRFLLSMFLFYYRL